MKLGEARGQTALILLGAVLFRLLIMPITFHGDLLFINYGPYFFSHHGVWDIYGYFGDHYIKNNGASYYPPMVYYTVGFFHYLTVILSPLFAAFIEKYHAFEYAYTPANVSDFFDGFNLADRAQLIFAMKAPYLLADAACVALMMRLCPTGKAWLRWLWHPVLLFSIYVFGTYRIYSAALILAFCWCVQNKQKALAMLIYAAVALMENYALVLLPITVISLSRDIREAARLALIFMLSFGVIMVPLWLHSRGYVGFAYYSPLLMKAAGQGLFRSAPVWLSVAGKGVFAIGYLKVLWTVWRLRKLPSDGGARLDLWIACVMIVLLLLYATSQTMVHYFMWILPLWLIFRQGQLPWPKMLSVGFIVLLFVFNLDSRNLNFGLFAVVDPAYFSSLPSFHEMIAGYFPWGKIVALSRAGFSLLCFYFTYRLYRIIRMSYNEVHQ